MKFIVWDKEIQNKPGVVLLKGSIEVEFANGPNGVLLTVLKKTPEDLEILPEDILELSS